MFKGKQQMEPKKLSSYHTSDEVLTLTSEHLSSEDSFDRKFKAKFYPYNQIFEQPEEYLIEFKGKQQMGQKRSHQNKLKINCLLSLLKIHLLNIASRPNYRPILINLIKVLNNHKKNC